MQACLETKGKRMLKRVIAKFAAAVQQKLGPDSDSVESGVAASGSGASADTYESVIKSGVGSMVANIVPRVMDRFKKLLEGRGKAFAVRCNAQALKLLQPLYSDMSGASAGSSQANDREFSNTGSAAAEWLKSAVANPGGVLATAVGSRSGAPVSSGGSGRSTLDDETLAATLRWFVAHSTADLGDMPVSTGDVLARADRK